MISVLAGGVGAARFLRGLCLAIDPQRVVAVVNTGDDTELHGLSISPDIDTVIYTLAEAIDPERGWGLRDETWRAMASLERFTHVRPTSSRAAPTWFNLGDQDLATHFYRTARLQEGATLTELTDEIRRSFDVSVRVVPMTNDKVRTLVNIAQCDSPVSGKTISFQEYFVAHRHSIPVASVTFEGAQTAVFNSAAGLHDAERIIIAPSNPIVSIGPLRALSGVDDLLRARRDDVVAVSPIVAGAALKGPADRMLRELGMEPSVVGVARLYADVCGTLVIDTQDAHLASLVEAEGMRCVVTNTIMSDPGVARDLATLTLA
ncbi:MAG: 2-phospho-L-lactate transferase [Actinobacteria bacterium]|nr:2-phospho-L-lactate transferase [Actinomycetota bacterium]